MWSVGPENVSESRRNGGVSVPGVCRFGVCDKLASVLVPSSRSRPSLSDDLMRSFSELGLQMFRGTEWLQETSVRPSGDSCPNG
jgi:hypothetical protein